MKKSDKYTNEGLFFNQLYCLLTLIIACTIDSSWGQTQKTIVTSIPPLHFLLQDIGGSLINSLPNEINTSSDFHHFQIKPSQIIKWSSADRILWLGPHWEPLLAKAFQKIDQDKLWIAGQTEGLNLLPIRNPPAPHKDTNYTEKDPHFWLSLENTRALALWLQDKLSTLLPKHSAYFEQRTQTFTKHLEQLQTQWLDKKNKPDVIYYYVAEHDAFQYLEPTLGLTLLGTLNTNHHTPISLGQLTSLQKSIQKKQIHCLVILSNQPQRWMLKLFSSKVHIVTTDPFGQNNSLRPNQWKNSYYLSFLTHTLEQLSTCINKATPQKNTS